MGAIQAGLKTVDPSPRYTGFIDRAAPMNRTSKPLSLTPQEIAIFKAMSPAQKLALMSRMYFDARSLKRAGLKMQHPEWDEAQLEAKVRELFLYGTD